MYGDASFAKNRMVGVLGALDVTSQTWFGDNVEYVHGINMMPFTPISSEYLRYDFVSQEYPLVYE